MSELPIPGSTARAEAATELALMSSFRYCMEQKSVQSMCYRAPGPLGTSSSLAVLMNILSRSVEELYKNKLPLFFYFSLLIWYI